MINVITKSALMLLTVHPLTSLSCSCSCSLSLLLSLPPSVSLSVASHGPQGLLEELPSADCDGTKSGADPLGLVQTAAEPAAAQGQRQLHPRAGYRGLRVASFSLQEQVTGDSLRQLE